MTGPESALEGLWLQRYRLRVELVGRQYTVGASTVWAQGEDPVGMILRAVSW
ncbi:hypothetical protein Aple_059390 [Acrocarpospora pleiomorpha]|uniref:Uncharacterized protein n=1 Tax=Acrocarpospora pleiomorpha TaxID=90975 RepID=A0A5M3XQC6_9ACTN|nr:hypothetical protein Aple_059390 [Acrocarpospora pleiomorpha]